MYLLYINISIENLVKKSLAKNIQIIKEMVNRSCCKILCFQKNIRMIDPVRIQVSPAVVV